MFGEISNMLWQPKKRWQRILFVAISAAAWATLAVSLILGWFYQPVLIACVLLMGLLGVFQLIMTASAGVRTYSGDQSE